MLIQQAYQPLQWQLEQQQLEEEEEDVTDWIEEQIDAFDKLHRPDDPPPRQDSNNEQAGKGETGPAPKTTAAT